MVEMYHRFWERVRRPEDFLKAVDAVWKVTGRDEADYFGAIVFAAAPPTFIALELAQEFFLVESSRMFWSQLRDLNWYVYFESSVRLVLSERARAFVESACSGKYGSDVFTRVILPWRDGIVASWIFGNDSLIETLDFVLRESYVSTRLSEMYEILTDFPESKKAVIEMKHVLLTTRQDIFVADAIMSVLKRRVLHAGANTSQILDVYAAAVDLLRLVDDPDDLKCQFSSARMPRSREVVAAPVRAYLRKRRDAVRCIVRHITESTGQDELVSMLVSIFGSREIFAHEYRVMLAEKLLMSSMNRNVDNELEILELLKMRFRDLSFQHSEVMLRDVEDSIRLNRTSGVAHTLEVTVISHFFWPPPPSSQHHVVSLHRRLAKMMSDYSKKYQSQKAPRQLEWMPLQGTVKLKIRASGGHPSKALMITVTPFVASLILFFDGEASVTLQHLAAHSNVSEKVVQRKMRKWMNQGILQEAQPGTYHVKIPENNYRGSCVSFQKLCEDEVDDADIDAGPPWKKQDRAVSSFSNISGNRENPLYVSYILGMLKNLGGLSEEAIHNMLKMFADEDHQYTFSQGDLRQLLQDLCHADIIAQHSKDRTFYLL